MEWAVAYELVFADDGPPVRCILHVGTAEECRRGAAGIPPSTPCPYSGPRDCVGGFVVTFALSALTPA